MNDNLDEWLNSLGFDNEPSVSPTNAVTAADETTASLPEVIATTSLSEQDFSDVLEEFGFNHSEEGEAEEVEEEEDTNFDSQDATTNDNFEGFHTVAVPRFVGDNDLTQNGDFTVDSLTGEIHILTENGVQTIEGNLEDLDAEEDADWQEAIDSGRVVPVPHNEDDSEGNQPNTHQSPQEDNVYFYMPNGEVITVPIIHEGEQDPHELEQAAIEDHQTVVETPAQSPLIPVNSPTLLLDESTTRFSGAEWFNEIQRQSIIIAGIGGIGSNCAFQLSRMHPASIFMYDDDSVETVNMAGQLYARNDVGKSKVSAMSDMIQNYTNMQNVYAIREKFTENTEAGNIMICGFDNMEARKTFFNTWYNRVIHLDEEERKKCLFLDGRLDMTCLQVLCMTGDDAVNIKRYKDEYLFSDNEADHTICSMKQTTYLACMIASVMVNLFTNFTANLLDPVIPYDLPFFTEYDAQNMIFKTVS